METRSKARGGLLSNTELGQDRQSPQSPLVRSAGNVMVREPMADFHRDGALTAVSTAVTLGTTVHAPSAVCAVRERNPTLETNVHFNSFLLEHTLLHFPYSSVHLSAHRLISAIQR